MAEILETKEKREREDGDGYHMPTFTSVAHGVPSFMSLPKGVLTVKAPYSEVGGGEDPQVLYMMKMVFAIVKENPFHVREANNGDEAAEIWTCRNQTGQIFGKFSARQMYDWSKAGCFEPTLEIKHDGMVAF